MKTAMNLMRRALIHVLPAMILPALLSCGRDKPGVEGNTGGQVLKFRQFEQFDPAAGVNAFSMLIPAGWETAGGITWRPHLSNQAAAAVQIRNPGGKEVLEIMPCDPFTWRTGGVPFFGQGSIYLGNEVRPPIMDPTQYVLSIAIPRYRREITNPQVVSAMPLPRLAQAIATARAEPGVRKEGHAARVRVAYTSGGINMHEDFYCVLLMAQGMPGAPGLSFWGPDSLTSFRAEAGRLDELEGVARTMLSSVRITPAWFNIFAQVQQMWTQNQMRAIKNAGRISDYISHTSSEISDTMMKAYENRQAAQDCISRETSEYIRGVETYSDPNRSNPVELPSGYNHAWVTPGGEYILTDNPNYNPNVGDNRNWQLMSPAR